MQLISSTFSNKHRAIEVLADLGDLDLDWGVPLDNAAAALTINKHGKVRVHRSHEAATTGALLGGVTGLLTGLLVFAPGVGAAIGAATGSAIGALADPTPLSGIDKDFLKSLGSNLKKDSSALIVFVPDDSAAAALASIEAYDEGVVAKTVVDAATDQAIREAYEQSIA